MGTDGLFAVVSLVLDSQSCFQKLMHSYARKLRGNWIDVKRDLAYYFTEKKVLLEGENWFLWIRNFTIYKLEFSTVITLIFFRNTKRKEFNLNFAKDYSLVDKVFIYHDLWWLILSKDNLCSMIKSLKKSVKKCLPARNPRLVWQKYIILTIK